MRLDLEVLERMKLTERGSRISAPVGRSRVQMRPHPPSLFVWSWWSDIAAQNEIVPYHRHFQRQTPDSRSRCRYFQITQSRKEPIRWLDQSGVGWTKEKKLENSQILTCNLTTLSNASVFEKSVGTWWMRWFHQLGDENRCRMATEQRSKRMGGTTVGSRQNVRI